MTTLSTPTRQPAREPRQGKSLLSRLAAAGINASSVTRNRRTGVYTVKFVAPNVNDFYSKGTDSARVWAERIQAALPGVEIIGTHDSVADWRPRMPVMSATVFLTLPKNQNARQTEVEQAS
jgi:hypothetical protein